MTSTNETLDMAKNSLRKRFNSNSLQQLLIFATWIVLLIGFSIADPHFMRMGNIVALLLASAVTGIQALGVTFTIATGGIDITPGLGMAMTGIPSAHLAGGIGRHPFRCGAWLDQRSAHCGFWRSAHDCDIGDDAGCARRRTDFVRFQARIYH